MSSDRETTERSDATDAPTRRRLLGAVGALGAAGLAGCSGGGTGGTETTATTGTTATTTTATTTAAPDATVRTDGIAFSPVRTSVSTGDTVEWVNEGSTAHDVTARQLTDAGADWNLAAELPGGGRVTYTFEEAGAYEYVCTIHGGSSMCGVVLVGEPSYDASLPCESGGDGDGDDGPSY